MDKGRDHYNRTYPSTACHDRWVVVVLQGTFWYSIVLQLRQGCCEVLTYVAQATTRRAKSEGIPVGSEVTNGSKKPMTWKFVRADPARDAS